MKNTVKLEQFVALKEKDLQKIKGGIFFSYEKSNEIRRKSNGFTWIWDSYCSFFNY
ncbi:competence-stimulating peptide ComC [Streptococcus pneumoniae]|uniref:competence-stimulating peptide ComC n=1 Tax=Streptococcus pneumoniae TaxID=1313 RepID=UPI0002732BB2|nr:competence-stimulating peptide ComC [Streptococcus pneumoniae]EJG76071.1 competence-stimulating peptide type 2 [Streptococcus pneumoniae 2082170]CVY51508.1 competence-stimulating peptide type 1 [Streptococcus pneumoniae]CWF59728.1 competence-stimulating peptide type 1 [Streptococcus pneumoniae]HET0096961.1 competence-stimulating peptide ComC [Streptococcus pneumoniae]HET0389082.1 competence-stimulating peptide ComC [Streptococcus pneumoniae]